ncbi:aspartate aminotransferase family protein [Halobacillus yeomjeoni]|uniref:aspartate aminotransferase family protein n=1 Tax=Halobacillus yeomjeoni TaxID=311194 RepID=UPI001CD7BDA1|nr:aspartate aminotransferase family protein [Halobacillus yeomjeoni]MCA0985622.1 aspartate aminotransferase family protein [Halobacillus yeomjeoni]
MREQLDRSHYKTNRSAELYERAKLSIPGGVTANIKHFSPHPLFMKKGKGSKLYDADNHSYVDYLLCYGALILGHGHPAVYEAVIDQWSAAGTPVFGTPHEIETVMAEKLISLYRGIDSVRFTNSGLEATMLALRVASAFTGRSKVAKFEGHYHGGYDQVLFSIQPAPGEAGAADRPETIPESKGIPDYYTNHTIVLPFNDLEATKNLLRENAEELAAVIVEPVQGGFIPAHQAFMQGLRDITKELGIVLIFDEVKTGFRLSVGGAQELYKITPDLTALGKVLGGGFPVGAVGGRKDMMALLSPDGQDLLSAGGRQPSSERGLFHSGTYNGHPLVLAAGLATIEVLEKEGVMRNLFDTTDILRNELEALYLHYDLPMQTIGLGSIFNIVMTDRDIENYRDMKKADLNVRKRIDERVLKFGVYSKPLNRYSLSTVHDEQDLDFTIKAHEKAIIGMKDTYTKRIF